MIVSSNQHLDCRCLRAQEPTPEEPEPEAATEAPLISTELAIIIAVVVVAIIAAVAYLVIRKRK